MMATILAQMPHPDQPTHKVLMTFFLCKGWNVSFLEEDCRTPLPKKCTYSTEEPIRELARRGGALVDPEAEERLDQEIQVDKAPKTGDRTITYIFIAPR